MEKKVQTKSAPNINNEKDLDDVIKEINDEIFSAKLEEFYLIDTNKLLKDLKNFYNDSKTKNTTQDSNDKSFQNKSFNDCLLNYGAKRYGVNIDFAKIGKYYYHENIKENDFINSIVNEANKMNEIWKKKSNDLLSEALTNIRNAIKYRFLELKKYKVTDTNAMHENYFTVFDRNNPETIFANNGWLYGVSDTTENFANYGTWRYFSRGVVIWSDCPKLR